MRINAKEVPRNLIKAINETLKLQTTKGSYILKHETPSCPEFFAKIPLNDLGQMHLMINSAVVFIRIDLWYYSDPSISISYRVEHEIGTHTYDMKYIYNRKTKIFKKC